MFVKNMHQVASVFLKKNSKNFHKKVLREKLNDGVFGVFTKFWVGGSKCSEKFNEVFFSSYILLTISPT